MTKYLWLNGTTHERPDPNWTEEEAFLRKLIPARVSNFPPRLAVSTQNPHHDVIMNSLGSIAWDRTGFNKN